MLWNGIKKSYYGYSCRVACRIFRNVAISRNSSRTTACPRTWWRSWTSTRYTCGAAPAGCSSPTSSPQRRIASSWASCPPPTSDTSLAWDLRPHWHATKSMRLLIPWEFHKILPNFALLSPPPSRVHFSQIGSAVLVWRSTDWRAYTYVSTAISAPNPAASLFYFDCVVSPMGWSICTLITNPVLIIILNTHLYSFFEILVPLTPLWRCAQFITRKLKLFIRNQGTVRDLNLRKEAKPPTCANSVDCQCRLLTV